MKCPHCTQFFHEGSRLRVETIGHDEGHDEDYEDEEDGGETDNEERNILKSYAVSTINCEACSRLIARLHSGPTRTTSQGYKRVGQPSESRLILPPAPNRVTFAEAVPISIKEDYDEAVTVLPYSQKASAALSRRCLQNIIRELAGITKPNLDQEIQALLDEGALPSYIADPLDSVRVVGNFAAHPIKSQATGTIVDIAPGEAELCLDVIESLFDFYIIQPALQKAKLDAINIKLQEAGKPPLKTTKPPNKP